jgi:hypothetical protein
MSGAHPTFGLNVTSVLLVASIVPAAFSQAPLNVAGSPVRIFSTDMAVLEEQEVRKDLACTVTPTKPTLGFDLRFHTGYDVSVPIKELAGTENLLTILFRVTSEGHKEDPVYFVQRVKVPLMEDDAKGDAILTGALDLGEGNYHVDWLMRDRAERVCSFYWDSEAMLPAKDKQIELALAPSAIERAEFEQFTEDPPVERTQGADPLNIKILVNFGPQNPNSPLLRPADTTALVTMLRRLAREPQFGKFSLVAFNMQEQRVLYRQLSEDRIDFPALGDAVQKVKLGTVDMKKLAQKHGETEFLADLIKQEMGTPDHPDAVIFAGPKIMLDEGLPEDSIKPYAADVDYPVFYMNYVLNPVAVPWKDSISRAIKVFRGTEYTVTRPRDLWFAVSEIVSRIARAKHGHAVGGSAAQ